MSERTYGAPLSKEMVRTLRERAGLSQEALALRLGLAGKAVVSGWETGRTTCEGPAAELLMYLFAADTSRTFIELSTNVEATWRRAGTWQDAWRQIAAIPEAPLAIGRDAFAGLFPGTEIPPREHWLGFPFVRVPEANVFGIGTLGWSGSMPADHDRAPRFLWQLDRRGSFVFRETPWEDGYDIELFGHTHAGSLLELAICTVVFLGRFADAAKIDHQWRYALRIDLEGMRGRGIVTGRDVTPPNMRCNDRHLTAEHTCTLRDTIAKPVATACALVAELLTLIRPELASREQLEDLLRTRHRLDRERERRVLGSLDSLL